MSFNRQYSMFRSNAIHSPMPMVVGRIQYEEPMVKIIAKTIVPTKTGSEVMYKNKVITTIKHVMNLYEITHNNPASIRIVPNTHPNAVHHKPIYEVDYKYVNLMDISKNNKADISFIQLH